MSTIRLRNASPSLRYLLKWIPTSAFWYHLFELVSPGGVSECIHFIKILNSGQNIIIAGDLNFAHRTWSNAGSNAFGYALRKIVNNKSNVRIVAPHTPTHINAGSRPGARDSIIDLAILKNIPFNHDIRVIHWCAKIKNEVEKLAYQLNEEAKRTERSIRRLSKVMYGSTCSDMQVDVMGECLSSIKHVVGVRSVFLAKRLHAV
ncbi:uncharacterized protein TNCV_1232531 [Trichonephila clavipes]|nr:uncharacterized protein TNCV_1232531 [Trichonephila clavipes]